MRLPHQQEPSLTSIEHCSLCVSSAEDRFEVEADGKLITIFSAPNYCDQMANKGAYIRFKSDMSPDIRQFVAVPHPDIKPMAYAANAGLMGLT